MIFYAVQHVPSGNYIPQVKRGEYTATQTAAEPEASCIPKLYRTRVGAERFLRSWAKGRIMPNVKRTPSFLADDIQPDYRRWIHVPVRGRRYEDMRIVPIALYPQT